MTPGVRLLRLRLGLTAPELAFALHVHRHTVWSWDTGTTKPRGLHQAHLKALQRRLEGGT
ncbi:MAG TPA: hypothetical protein VJB57_08860 [Dehalococcoidia bacterium]|nr:hypothetical protein [Dehalococcoidia bacterium]